VTHRRERLLRPLLAFAVFVSLFVSVREASAYPWMISKGYTACAQCHADPSGAGLLTAYGRAQSALLLSSFDPPGAREEGEPSNLSRQLFGVLPENEWLLVGGWVRNGYLWNYSRGELVDHRFLQMRADLGAQVKVDRFRASATVGYQRAESASFAQRAWVTGAAASGNVVSREHWLGFDVSDAVLIRAGRLELPFGLRNIEHTSFVRASTRTDVNQAQQHGVAVSFNDDGWRAEGMAILGNFQVRPDAFRERGYAAYLERAFGTHVAVGVSSLVTRAEVDIDSSRRTVRQAHGPFARIGLSERIAVLGEADVLVATVKNAPNTTGYAGLLQLDAEVVRGLHVIGTGEGTRRGIAGETPTWGAWASAAWFVVPHVDVRVDFLYRTALDSPATSTLLFQGHLYL
jgi:hypothetical protein